MRNTRLMASTLAAAALFASAPARAHQADVDDRGENSRIAIAQIGSACVSFVTVRVDDRDVRVKVDVQCPKNGGNGASEAHVASATLKHRAVAAVASYYALHAVNDGTVSPDLAALYAPTLDRAGMLVAREDHLADLANYAGRYQDLGFDVVADSLDLDGCTTPARCVVRGTVATTATGMASGQTRHGAADFALMLDLRGRTRVTGECSMTAAASNARGCANYPFK